MTLIIYASTNIPFNTQLILWQHQVPCIIVIHDTNSDQCKRSSIKVYFCEDVNEWATDLHSPGSKHVGSTKSDVFITTNNCSPAASLLQASSSSSQPSCQSTQNTDLSGTSSSISPRNFVCSRILLLKLIDGSVRCYAKVGQPYKLSILSMEGRSEQIKRASCILCILAFN